MKKIFSIFMVISLCLGMVGCGNTVSSTSVTTSVSVSASVEKVTESVKEEKKEEVKETVKEEKQTETSVEKKEETVKDNQEASEKEYANEALEFVAGLKLGWNLGNTLDATGTKNMKSETSWGMPAVTKEQIEFVKASGFTSIRIPVSWGNHMDASYNINPEWMARVTEIVDYALDAGLYVILNSHHDNDYYYPSEANLDNAKNFLTVMWTQIAENFKDYDERLIFEAMNEPRLANTAIEWWFDAKDPEGCAAIERISQLDQVFIDVIRSCDGYNKERYLMVSSYAASPDFTMHDSFTVPTDERGRMIISIHAYTPYDFAMNENGYSTWYATNNPELDFIKKLNTTFVSKGIPVIIGECGATNKNNLDARVAWAKVYTKKAALYGIPCFVWDNGLTKVGSENFGLLDRNSLSVFYPELLDAYLSGYAE